MTQETDAEILDWVARQDLEMFVIGFEHDGQYADHYRVHGDHKKAGMGKTLREAFYAAMKNSREGN